jgi:hypothetical protein
MSRCVLVFLFALTLVSCPEPDPELPQPGEFVAGSASVRMQVPLGVGVTGNGFFGVPSNPGPYADRYPATDRFHGHPNFVAIVMSRGPGFEVIFLRSDMIAVIQQLRDAILVELEQRTGRDFDDALIMGATHTHSGPGRFIQGGLFNLIADYFVPQHYEALVHAGADAVEAALADVGPAELGYTLAQAPDAHADRRCEDLLDYTNDQLGILAIRKQGEVTALVLNYAVHGTIVGLDEFTLSQDASGAIEEFVEQGFDHPVDVLLNNSWAADVSPATPPLDPLEGASPLPPGYDRMEAMGTYMSGIVQDSIGGIAWSAEPDIRSKTYRLPINREAIGYEWGEFDFEYGAIYCSRDGDCEQLTNYPDLTDGCIPFPDFSPAPQTTVMTVGTLGGAHFTTWAGECGTLLAEETMASMREHDGVGDILFFGYSQDYLGYALQEEDWWHGGYEASGAMWGPKQGEYLKRVQAQIFDHWMGVTEELPYTEPGPAARFDLTDGEVWVADEALLAGTVSAEPDASYPTDGVVSFAVAGSDPLFGAPVARLQREVGGEFVDVLTPDGRPRDSDGYGFWVDLRPDPTYEDTLDPTPRAFHWTFNLPITTRAMALEPGTYRFATEIPMASGVSVSPSSQSFVIE